MDGGSTSGVTDFTTIATQTNAADDEFVTDPSLNPLLIGDIYAFRVIAENVVGESTPSGIFSAMAAVRPSAPSTPTRKTATTESLTI